MARGTHDDTPTPVGGADTPPQSPPADGPVLHPVADFARRARTRLDDLAAPSARPVWAMTTDELTTTLTDLAMVANQVAALTLAVLTEADRNGHVAAPGDRTAADWLARETRQRRNTARADLRLGRALDTDLPVLATAMAAGGVSLDQARVIKRSIDLLPVNGEFTVTPAQRSDAETHLVDLAAHHDAADLEVLGRRIYAVICPEAADAYEGRLLEAQEARAARKTTLETWTDHQGITHGRFRIPQLHGAMLKKALDAIMSPVRAATNEQPETSERDTRPLPVRRGEAFCELLERLSARDLPVTAGGDATVVVTMQLDDLTAALETAGVATLDTGQRISAAETRRLACQHRLVPAVLDSHSAPLDLGRTQRLHTKAQRLAMAIRDGGCTAKHCDTPAAMCHAHHDTPWSEGGHTNVQSGRLLCGPHHRRIHDPAYLHTRLPTAPSASADAPRCRPDGALSAARAPGSTAPVRGRRAARR